MDSEDNKFTRGELSQANSGQPTPPPTDPVVVTPVTPAYENGLKQSPLSRFTSKLRHSGSDGTSNGPSKVGLFVRRFWLPLLILIVIIAGLIGWRAYENHIDDQWNKAADYYGRADYADAAKILNNMKIPTDQKRLTIYAQTMLATRQLDKALPAYQALYNANKDAGVKLIIGNIYNEQKKYDEAAKAYSELITANSGYVQAYVNLSTLDKLQGKGADAITVAKNGVAANPNSATLYELLISMTIDNKNSSDYQNAVAALKKLNPQDPIFQTIDEQ